MGRPFVNPRTPEGDFLSADELIGALEALLPDEKLKLAEIEAIRSRGTGFVPSELVQEAVCRALAGDRNCPRAVPFMAFMAQTMRSIASHDRKERSRLQPLEDVEQSRETQDNDRAVIRSAAPSPEDGLMQKQDAETVQAIHRCFDDDPDAQLVLMGLQDDLRGAELREATGLDQGQLDYAVKRIRTRMRKTYPHGRIT